jgi:hypothetical protein
MSRFATTSVAQSGRWCDACAFSVRPIRSAGAFSPTAHDRAHLPRRDAQPVERAIEVEIVDGGAFARDRLADRRADRAGRDVRRGVPA